MADAGAGIGSERAMRKSDDCKAMITTSSRTSAATPPRMYARIMLVLPCWPAAVLAGGCRGDPALLALRARIVSLEAGTQALVLLLQFRGELGPEVGRLEQRADFDFALLLHRVGAALDPVDGLGQRFHVPQPVSGDQLLGLGKRAIDHCSLVAVEADA